MDMDGKLRPIYLLKILKERTDEEHSLSTVDLCTILRNEYGIDTFRTTIKSDIELLQKMGYGIQVIRSSQNLYNYIDRDFEIPEIKLLIDAVMSSKFITKKKADELAEKLAKLAGPYKAGDIRRNLVVDGRYKPENEQVYIIADAINEAINLKKKISFQKFEYNSKKEKVLHHDGEVYIFSPYSLVWDGDYYYVVGYSDKHNGIGSHRVDFIYKRPDILNEPAVEPGDDFDINRYVNSMFRMYNAKRQEVELQVDNDLMNPIIDKFGQDVETCRFDKNSFLVTATVGVGVTFYNWIFGFRGRVKIRKPLSVKQEYEKMVEEAAGSLGIIV